MSVGHQESLRGTERTSRLRQPQTHHRRDSRDIKDVLADLASDWTRAEAAMSIQSFQDVSVRHHPQSGYGTNLCVGRIDWKCLDIGSQGRSSRKFVPLARHVLTMNFHAFDFSPKYRRQSGKYRRRYRTIVDSPHLSQTLFGRCALKTRSLSPLAFHLS